MLIGVVDADIDFIGSSYTERDPPEHARPTTDQRQEQQKEYVASCKTDYKKWFDDTVEELADLVENHR